MTDQTSNVAFVLTGQFFEKYIKNIEIFIQIITRLEGEKFSRVEGSLSQPSQFVSNVYVTKTLPRLTELTAGGLSSEFTNHRDFYIASSIQ